MPKHKKFHKQISEEVLKCEDLVSEIVKSVIELIDPVRTKREHLSDLEKTEKTFIGTKVETILRYQLRENVKRGTLMDCLLDSTEFDIKCTTANNWMIPQEAVGHFCLIVKIDWDNRRISIGSFWAKLENLGEGKNQDKKRSISKIGKQSIKWIHHEKAFVIPNEVPHVEWKPRS